MCVCVCVCRGVCMCVCECLGGGACLLASACVSTRMCSVFPYLCSQSLLRQKRKTLSVFDLIT